eukprot:SAG31_NODE_5_length_43735_cov_42.922266_16_plen_87_part_00
MGLLVDCHSISAPAVLQINRARQIFLNHDQPETDGGKLRRLNGKTRLSSLLHGLETIPSRLVLLAEMKRLQKVRCMSTITSLLDPP